MKFEDDQMEENEEEKMVSGKERREGKEWALLKEALLVQRLVN